MRLQVFDSDGSIGGGNKLADTLSKAFFGDGEAAAKIALAKAQIAAQQAHAGYYGAQTGKTQQDTRIEGERHQTNKTLGERAAEEARLRVQPPQPLPIPIPSGTESIRPGGAVSEIAPAPVDLGLRITAPPPMPVQVAPVTPQQTSLYQAQREAEAARARAVAIAGGNAQQVAQGINLQTGGSLLRHPGSPTDARVGATLTTGNLPSTTTVVVPGDTAGVDAAGRVAATAEDDKPRPGPVDPNTGLATYYVRDRTSVSGWRQVTSDGLPAPKKPDQASNAEVDSRITGVQTKMREGLPISQQEAEGYARDVQTRYETDVVEGKDAAGNDIKTRMLKLPYLMPHPNKVWERAAAGSTGAPTTAPMVPGASPPVTPAPLATPAPLTAPAPEGSVGLTSVVKPAPLNFPLTAEAGKARGFALELGEALPYFSKVAPENVPQDILKTIVSIPGDSVPYTLFLQQFSDPATKQWVTAALNVIYPGLRFVSGAVINKNEVVSEIMKQVPLPDDGQAQIDQKLAMMAVKARGLAIAGFGHEKTPEYQAWANGLKAKGFDINRTFTGTAADYVNGQPVRPTAPGGAVGAPANKPVRKLDLTTGKFN